MFLFWSPRHHLLSFRRNRALPHVSIGATRSPPPKRPPHEDTFSPHRQSSYAQHPILNSIKATPSPLCHRQFLFTFPPVRCPPSSVRCPSFTMFPNGGPYLTIFRSFEDSGLFLHLHVRPARFLQFFPRGVFPSRRLARRVNYVGLPTFLFLTQREVYPPRGCPPPFFE